MSRKKTAPTSRGRFSASRKRDAVLRLLRGEELDLVARELGVHAHTLASWKEGFLDSGLEGLTVRPKDARDEHIRKLERKLGKMTMENELLYEKIERMEDGRPLVPRRSKK